MRKSRSVLYELLAPETHLSVENLAFTWCCELGNLSSTEICIVKLAFAMGFGHKWCLKTPDAVQTLVFEMTANHQTLEIGDLLVF